MPLDPLIPLSVRGPQIQSPLDALSRVLQFQNQQEQYRGLAAERQAMAEERQARTASITQQTEQQAHLAAVHQAASEAINHIRSGNAEAVLSQLDPEARAVAEDWLQKFNDNRQKREAILMKDRKERAQLIQKFGYNKVVGAVMFGLDDDPQAAEMFKQLGGDDEAFKRIVDGFATMGDKPEPGFSLSPGQTRYDAAGKVIATEPAKEPTSPPGFNLSPGQTRFDASGQPIAHLPPAPPSAASQAAQGTTDDASSIAEAIANGDQPPVLTGLYRLAGPVRAALAKKGYDLTTATLDWQATTKHLATLNNAQQTRLNQSINALPELLDSVDALAQKWKGGRFPILNSANLALAKGGTFGEDVASVARQLDSQIADVVADLGNVYMGGNSPTDHALQLAGKSLGSAWSEKVLHDMVTLAKKNVIIRQNSIKNTGVAGASPNNPYAPPVPPATPPATSGTPSYQDYLKSKQPKP